MEGNCSALMSTEDCFICMSCTDWSSMSWCDIQHPFLEHKCEKFLVNIYTQCCTADCNPDETSPGSGSAGTSYLCSLSFWMLLMSWIVSVSLQ
eukprot:Skav215164  [mRNA]  locus=scaffold4093:56873:57151:- [translate_table: standard]